MFLSQNMCSNTLYGQQLPTLQCQAAQRCVAERKAMDHEVRGIKRCASAIWLLHTGGNAPNPGVM